jgi:hypothetical protein
LRQIVREPKLFQIEYADGLRAHLLELNGAAGEWSAAWRYADGGAESTLFWVQEGRPGMHFTWLLHGIEQMMLTGKPSWNVERTLLSSGALHALWSPRKKTNAGSKRPTSACIINPPGGGVNHPPPSIGSGVNNELSAESKRGGFRLPVVIALIALMAGHFLASTGP